ncbi:hypothetical protein AVU39_gp43 [Sulfolobus monocaudavirus SMV2]|jgi:hypothetical protein|uniref:hypothetical protein n=1 Tax=Sulfolobus monocaudavirus SMV2 TaxID=1580591 RepID=UPI0006D31260|nr:hypothetical protein AVU39_gp43 [Sulfolobus monocaudavirus SMV2]AIZ11377.1 hypothetical protein [Sulfolobus monocaudavirus SMV2]
MNGNEIVEEILEFLNKKGAKFDIDQFETENKTLKLEVEFPKPIILTETEYDMLYDLLKSLGFYPVNGAENKINEYVGYKNYTGIEEFENDAGDKIWLEYNKVSVGGETTYFVKNVEVELNTEEFMNLLF